jgi:Uma2 family endonuclease
LTVKAPAVVAEVLSPSTAATDLGDKAAEYLRLPSVTTYLVFAQDEMKAWVFARSPNQLPAPEVIAGADAKITVSALALDLALADIYADIEFD